MSDDLIEYRAIELRSEPTGRIIDGMLLPFGVTAIGPAGPERAAPGAIPDAPVVVPLIDDHRYDDQGRPVSGPEIGYAEIRAELDGYHVRGVIDDTPAGRAVLHEIRAGTRRMLSIGFRALSAPVRGGIRWLDQIQPTHVASLTADNRPAYAGAQVLEVRSAPPTQETPPVDDTTPDTTAVVTEPAPAPAPAAAPEEVRALREEIAELSRAVATIPSAIKVGDSPATPWNPQEIRTAGEWAYYSARALGYVECSPEEVRISVEKLGGNVEQIRAAASTASTNLGGAIPEQFLGPIEDLVRSGRPFIDALGSLPMPSVGMEIHRPVASTGTQVAWEVSQGDEPASTAYVTTDVVGAIKALKGSNKLTLQAALRSSPSATDALLRDMASAMATELDASALKGTGTLTTSTGALAGALNNGSIQTQALATTTTAAFITAWAGAIQKVWTALNSQPAFAVMHPRRWAKVLQFVDGNGRPILNIDARPSQNTIGGGGIASGGSPAQMAQVQGSIMNVPIVVDANLPTNLGAGTNEDIIALVGAGSFELYEDTRRTASLINADSFQTTYGQAKLAALLPIRPSGFCTIAGAGLVP